MQLEAGWGKGPSFCYFFFSFQGVKSQQSDTYKSVKPKGDRLLGGQANSPSVYQKPRFNTTLSFSSFQQPLLLVADLMV